MCMCLYIFQTFLKNPLKIWPEVCKAAHNPRFSYISEIQNICSSLELPVIAKQIMVQQEVVVTTFIFL